MKKSIIHIKGFTIIELLVVIVIIALLTGIVITSLNPEKSKARDAKRISDVGQIQLALELYFDRCKEYPRTSPLVAPVPSCTTSSGTVNFDQYLSQIPTAPSGPSYSYFVNGDYNDYLLVTTLESNNSVLQDDSNISTFDGQTTGCGSGTNYCLGPK